MTIYKLYTDYVDEGTHATAETPPEAQTVHHAKSKNKTHNKSKHTKSAAPAQAWQAFENRCQAFMEQLAKDYVTVGVTSSPAIIPVQGQPGRYLVCQAVICSGKLL